MKVTFTIPVELEPLAKFDAKERGITKVVDGKTVADVDRAAETVALAHLASRQPLFDARQAERLAKAVSDAPATATKAQIVAAVEGLSE